MVLRIAEWVLIGLAAGAICDAIVGGMESLVLSAAETRSLEPRLGFALVGALVVVLTLIALVLAGERSRQGLIFGLAGSAISYLIGATHLAAASIALSVAVLGERAHRPAPAAARSLAAAAASSSSGRPSARAAGPRRKRASRR
jgi:hypothetical protein